ncbi:TonB-dependent receptor [Asticcacaulis sp.]|uniref:TonB-dependent receptor n=1 Tax=Asticcacaulis sp. TaxID=1872648 RepID=UPI003F7C38CA
MKKTLLLGTALSGLIMGSMGTAFAQDMATGQTDATAKSDGDTTEVIVTAQKRREKAQDVPISMTTFSEKQLQDRNITDLSKLANYTPSVEVTPGREGGAGLTVRGISTGVGGVGVDPSNGVYVDGVYIARDWVAMQSYLDVSRVEVLRGPQGTLYGRNSTGGAYNIYHNAPSKFFEAGASAELKSYNGQEYQGYISGPLFTDKLLGRLALGRTTGDQYGKNLQTNSRLKSADSNEYQAALEFRPTDTFDIILRADQYIDHSAGSAVYHLVRQGTVNEDANFPSDYYEYYSDYRQDTDFLKNRGWSAQATWDIGGGYQAKSITGGRYVHTSSQYDSDNTELPIYTAVRDDDSKTFSEELQLTSPTGGRFDWIIGAFYYTEDAHDLTTSGGPTALTLPTGLFTGATYAPLNISIPFENRSVFDSTNNTKSTALFGQFRYAFTDKLKGTLGLRQTHEERTFNGYVRRQFSDADAGFNPDTACQNLIADSDVTYPADSATQQSTCASYAAYYADYYVSTTDVAVARSKQTLTFDNLSARFVLDYTPNADTHYYASATSGFKSGGFNSYDTNTILVDTNGDGYVTVDDAGIINFQPPFDPEELWSYEIGVKGKAFDRKLQYALDAFYYDWSNIQSQIYNYEDRTSYITNDAKAKAMGIEFDAVSQPWTNGSIDFNGAWIESEYTHFGSTISDVITSTTDQDFTGTPLPGSPKWKFNLGVQHTLFLNGKGDLTLRGEYQLRSPTYFVYSRDPIARSGGYNLTNLRLTYRSADAKYSVGMYVENVFDERYDYYRYGSSDTGVIAIVGRPRTFGLRLSASY